jgi:hypothetical protein
MRWSNLARSALFSVAICCVAMPEAEAIEIFAPPGLAAQWLMTRLLRWSCGAAAGIAAVRIAAVPIAAAVRASQAARIAVVQATAIAAATVATVTAAATAIVATATVIAVTAMATVPMATAMARRQSAQRRSERRLPHTVVGSIVTAPESVTTTNLTAPTS